MGIVRLVDWGCLLCDVAVGSLIICTKPHASSGSRYLAVGGGDRKVHMWDVRSRQYIQASRHPLSSICRYYPVRLVSRLTSGGSSPQPSNSEGGPRCQRQSPVLGMLCRSSRFSELLTHI